MRHPPEWLGALAPETVGTSEHAGGPGIWPDLWSRRMRVMQVLGPIAWWEARRRSVETITDQAHHSSEAFANSLGNNLVRLRIAG